MRSLKGRRDDARVALVEAARAGDQEAAVSLASLAVRWRDMRSVAAVAEEASALLPRDVALLFEADKLRAEGEDRAALDRVSLAWEVDGEAASWAEDELQNIVGSWLPASPTSAWDHVWSELAAVAVAAERRDLVVALDALAVERGRPLYVAILGEFNAGKSTLINALLSTDVAPTGIRPTTATLHWVAWAPDPFARIVVSGGSDRVVMHDDLKATLDEMRSDGASIDRVFIYAPVERLKRIEILDTPGFNAPDTTHAEEARRGIEEAHVALWLLDATAPLKESERQVIEKVATAGVPLQVLVNKCDRLNADDLAKVMSYIEESLAETGIVSLEPPVPMSAQLALAGRLGDEDALARSGWVGVESLIERDIVNVADDLREQALRRKSARERYGKLLAKAEDKRERAMDALDRERSEVSGARAKTAMAIGSTVFGALMGRRLSRRTSSVITSARSTSRQKGQVRRAEQKVADLEAKMGDLNEELQAKVREIEEELDPMTDKLETVEIKPFKKNIRVEQIGIVWLPHLRDEAGSLRPLWSA